MTQNDLYITITGRSDGPHCGCESWIARRLPTTVAEKEVHADKVLLIRCGDFYEAYGLDALLLVEHAGLNPMAGRARAGCPVANLQATADCLTSAGLTVAVYEEVEPARQATADRQRGAAAVRRRLDLQEAAARRRGRPLWSERSRHSDGSRGRRLSLIHI